MIGYLDGALTFKSPNYVYIDCNGIGYHVNISLNTYAEIESLNKAKLWIHTHVNGQDGSQTLYGFFKEYERTLFVDLTSVSGVGPNTARIMLASGPSEIKSQIANGQVQAINKIKGIGPKTAKRIIIDLQDKFVKEGLVKDQNPVTESQLPVSEAISALTGLGFQKAQVEKQIAKIDIDGMTVETIIKTVLQQLSK